VQANKAKFRFITRAETAAVLEACPDHEWRLIVALCRFGGLRCPSEVLSLKWGHILWDKGRIVVPSPKTAHHPGQDSRVIPLFPELEPFLLEAFARQGEGGGGEYVVTRYRDTRTNLRTSFLKIIRRAGLKPWLRPFTNLRSSRETELAETFPLHVVTAWLGNSELVAAKHYLQIREADFERALASTDARDWAQKLAQTHVERGGTEAHGRETVDSAEGVNPVNFPDLRPPALQCRNLLSDKKLGKRSPLDSNQ